MKIRVSTISPKGHTLNERLSAKALNARMTAAGDNDITFLEDPSVVISLLPTAEGAEVKGTISAKIRQVCGRCLDETDRTVNIPFSAILRRTTREDDFGDGDGVISYFGDHVDVRNYLEDTIILELSPFWAHEIGDGNNCIK